MNKQQSIQSLFLDICEDAYNQGLYMFGILSSTRKGPEHPMRQPGYFYNRLSEEVKERIRNELKPEHMQSLLYKFVAWGPVIPWEEQRILDAKDGFKREKLKFELELMKHGWRP